MGHALKITNVFNLNVGKCAYSFSKLSDEVLNVFQF